MAAPQCAAELLDDAPWDDRSAEPSEFRSLNQRAAPGRFELRRTFMPALHFIPASVLSSSSSLKTDSDHHRRHEKQRGQTDCRSGKRWTQEAGVRDADVRNEDTNDEYDCSSSSGRRELRIEPATKGDGEPGEGNPAGEVRQERDNVVQRSASGSLGCRDARRL